MTKKPSPAGSKVEAQVVKGRDGRWWWFVIPDGMDRETAYRETAIHPEKLHGPFPDEAEVHENMRVTLFGEQCEVKDGGMWDPNWEKLH